MNQFVSSSPKQLLNSWKNFRQELFEEEDDLDVLNRLVEWFSYCPEVKPWRTWDNPEEWESPWEIIHQGLFCKSTRSYLMERTLFYSDEDRWSKNCQLWWVKDLAHSDIYLLLIVNEKWVLNFEHKRINHIDDVIDQIIVYNKFCPMDRNFIEI